MAKQFNGVINLDVRDSVADWSPYLAEEAPELMAVSRCPDFVMDKGHAFEWFKQMTDEDKYALIELLKTF